jgi:hypothetical protein
MSGNNQILIEEEVSRVKQYDKNKFQYSFHKKFEKL